MNHVRLTKQGKLLGNEVFQAFLGISENLKEFILLKRVFSLTLRLHFDNLIIY